MAAEPFSDRSYRSADKRSSLRCLAYCSAWLVNIIFSGLTGGRRLGDDPGGRNGVECHDYIFLRLSGNYEDGCTPQSSLPSIPRMFPSKGFMIFSSV